MANFNGTNPAAPGSAQNVVFAYSGTDVSAYMPSMVGDTGSGGKSGAVPAPGSGDAAAGKYLKANGTWTTPPTSSGATGPTGPTGPTGATGAAGTSVQPYTAVAHQWINAISSSGAASSTQPTASDITGLAASATTDTTVASNITTGTLPTAILPLASGTTRGAVIAGSNISVAAGTISVTNLTAGITLSNQVLTGRLFIQSTTAKSTTSTVNAGSWSTSETIGSLDLTFGVRIGANATAGSRWTGVISYENGVGARLLVLQDLGGNVAIGSTTDNGTDRLQVAGSVTATGQVSGAGLKSTGGLVLSRVSKSAAYTITTSDYSISADATSAAFTLSLPASPVDGQYYEATKIDSTANVVTVSGNGKNINGVSTRALSTQWQTLKFQYDATLAGWIVK